MCLNRILNNLKSDSRNFWLPVVCLLVLLLQACAGPQKRVEDADSQQRWQQRQAVLQDLKNWRLKGRIGIVSAEESGSASIHWEQQEQAYSLRILAPFGRGSLHIEGSDTGVVMRNGNGEEVRAGSAEELIWRQTGWLIPVSDLRSWIIGLPAQTHEQYRLDDNGRLAQLNDSEWAVEYRRYKRVKGYELPDKIRLSGPELSIKLSISKWELR